MSAQERQGWIVVGGLFVTLDVVYAGESAKFQLPFINLALVPEFWIELFGTKARRVSPGR
jgi:hypothetical protein